MLKGRERKKAGTSQYAADIEGQLQFYCSPSYNDALEGKMRLHFPSDGLQGLQTSVFSDFHIRQQDSIQ